MTVNLVEFHCLVYYTDMLGSEEYRYTFDGEMRWVNRNVNTAVYLASWRK
jgi:hypothetical protein